MQLKTRPQRYMFYGFMFLLGLALGFLVVTAGFKAHGATTTTARPTVSEHVSGTYMNQVYAWAAGRQVTITPRAGGIWVEVAGADEFGVGKTAEEAAKNFMESVDLMEHELNVPQPKKGM